jgi:hypothetical protein
MNSIIDSYTKNLSDSQNEIVQKLVNILLSENNFDVAIKWKQLTFTIDKDFHHWIVAINVTKNSVNLLFHFGGLLQDSTEIFKVGESKFLRKVEFLDAQSVDKKVISDLLQQALAKRKYFIENWKRLNAK